VFIPATVPEGWCLPAGNSLVGTEQSCGETPLPSTLLYFEPEYKIFLQYVNDLYTKVRDVTSQKVEFVEFAAAKHTSLRVVLCLDHFLFRVLNLLALYERQVWHMLHKCRATTNSIRML